MVVLRDLAPAAVSAICFWVAVSGLHIDVSSHGDVSIDIDQDSTVNHASQRPAKTFKDEDYRVILVHGTHQGRLMKDGSYEFVKFTNIPYAAAPNDSDTRWVQPYSPLDGEGLYDDSGTRMCPQATPGWSSKALEFQNDFKASGDLPSKWKTPITPDQYPPVPEKLVGNEDCLYLDVYVPKTVWDSRDQRRFVKTPPLLWIHGGSFVSGSKDDIGSPSGLLKTINQTEDALNSIIISINYRLGMFGWLKGLDDYDNSFPSNLGLQDQKFAMSWITDNIHSFGGDARYLSIMGQGAGAASIQHMITGSGAFRNPGYGRYPFPVKKALIQSPAHLPQLDAEFGRNVYRKVLSEAKVKDIEALAALKGEELMKINAKLVHASPYGQSTFGPDYDGYLLVDLPAARFAKGDFQREMATLQGYTGLDGLAFTPPWVRDTAALKKHVQTLFPNISSDALDEVAKLYPLASGDGAAASRRQITAVSEMLNDAMIRCSVHAHSSALDSDKAYEMFQYRYVFDAEPATHESDLNYIFYPSNPVKGAASVDKQLANRTQSFWGDFIQYGSFDIDSELYWPEYNKTARKVAKIGHYTDGKTDFKFAIENDPMDDASRKRCEFWNSKKFGPKSQSTTPRLRFQNELRR